MAIMPPSWLPRHHHDNYATIMASTPPSWLPRHHHGNHAAIRAPMPPSNPHGVHAIHLHGDQKAISTKRCTASGDKINISTAYMPSARHTCHHHHGKHAISTAYMPSSRQTCHHHGIHAIITAYMPSARHMCHHHGIHAIIAANGGACRIYARAEQEPTLKTTA